MGVFGEGYDVASDVVLILSLTMLLATACGPVDSVLLMAGHSWLSLRNSTVALAVNVGLNLVLIPLDGIRGAAIAWSVAIVVRNLLPLFQVRRHLAMWPLTRSSALVGSRRSRLLRQPVECLGDHARSSPSDWKHPPRRRDLRSTHAGIWSMRSQLGLDAFHAVIRRRAPDAPGATARA